MWINSAFLLERLDNDHETTQELLALFLTEYQRLLHELKTAVEQGQAVDRLGHSIKGMCRDTGANQLAQWAEDLEHGTGDAHQITQCMLATLPAVQQEVQQAVNAFSQKN